MARYNLRLQLAPHDMLRVRLNEEDVHYVPFSSDPDAGRKVRLPKGTLIYRGSDFSLFAKPVFCNDSWLIDLALLLRGQGQPSPLVGLNQGFDPLKSAVLENPINALDQQIVHPSLFLESEPPKLFVDGQW